MTIYDPLVLRFNEKHQYYYLTRGRETFYNPVSRALRTWENPEDAILWGEEALDETAQTEEISLVEYEGKKR